MYIPPNSILLGENMHDCIVIEKRLGKIENVKFGMGGYQDAMIGLSLTFSMQGSGVNTFISGGWTMERPEQARWTEQDREKQQATLVQKITSFLNEAKVDDVYKLKNIPVEVTLEGNVLKDWRILKEVL